jgi:hypothetical protein
MLRSVHYLDLDLDLDLVFRQKKREAIRRHS